MPKPQSFRKVSVLFSYLFILVGIVVLIGWVARITLLKSIFEGWVTLKVNTAIWLILSGITLLLWNKRIRTLLMERVIDVLSGIVFLMSCLTIVQYIFGFTTFIDELFVKGEINEIGSSNPGRPIPLTALSFLLFSFTFLPGVRNYGKAYFIQSNYFLIGVISFIAGTGYLLGTTTDNFSPAFAYLSIFTGVSYFSMMLAGLFSRPEDGIMKQISSETVGGSIFRKTFLFFIPGLVILGWFRVLGEQEGWFSVEHSKGILVVLALVSFGLIMYLSASSLTKSEQQLSINEQDLRQANSAFEKAEELAKIGSWEIDTSGELRKKKWSKQMFRLFGLKPTETAPPFSEFLQLLHPEDRVLVKDIYNQMERGVVPENRIFRSNPKRGEVKYYQPTLHIVKNEKGVSYKYFGTIQCVTERKIVEQKLKTREELFSKAFHSKIFGLAIVNKDRKVVDINETLTELLGIKREDLIGKTSVQIGLTDPGYIKKRDELLILILMNGRLDNYELDIITNKGKPMSFLLSVEPLQLNEEQHWLIYLKDVTEKRIAERKVEESENRLSTILDTEPECVKIIDLKGELTYMNPAGLAMLEADSFEMVKGRKALEYIHEPYLKKFYELVTYVFSGNTAKMEYEITGIKGTHKWMETHMVPLRNAEQKIYSLLSVTRDVSERKKSDDTIKKAIERYELLGKATNDAVWQWELQTDELWGNESFYKLYGLNKEVDSLKDLVPYSRAHPDEVAHLKASLENSFKKKESFFEVEFRFKLPDGLYKTFLDRTYISYDEAGKPVRLIGAMLDITERKKSEELVKDAHKRLLFHVENGPLGYIEWDKDFNIKSWSQKATEIFGWNKEEITERQRQGFSLIHDEDKPQIKKVDKLLTSGKLTSNHLIYRNHTKSGKVIWCEWFDSVLLNKEGNVETIMSLVQDITNRKTIEQQLIDSEERLSRAEKMGNLGYGYYDMVSDKMHLSAGLYKIFGVSQEVFSHSIEGLKSTIHPEDHAIMNKAIDGLFKKGKIEVEFRILRPDGVIKNVIFKTVLAKNDKGILLNSFTTALDITESRNAEIQIKDYNKQLKQLAANLQNIREEERRRIGREVHDELGQWLTVLKMEISRVKKNKNDEDKLNESISEMLIQIDSCIKSSRRISTDLRPTIIDDLGLIAALEWQAEEFGKRAKIKSVFKTEIEMLELPTDFTIGIFRIFQESLTNVARHANATQVLCSLIIKEDNLILSIIDNGVGFNTATIGSKKTLGIIGMKERTQLMEGIYDIKSSIGSGTEITVMIPLPVVIH